LRTIPPEVSKEESNKNSKRALMHFGLGVTKTLNQGALSKEQFSQTEDVRIYEIHFSLSFFFSQYHFILQSMSKKLHHPHHHNSRMWSVIIILRGKKLIKSERNNQLKLCSLFSLCKVDGRWMIFIVKI
jgi:hypothetical protein